MKHKFNDVLDDMYYANLEQEHLWMQSSEDDARDAKNDYGNDYECQQHFHEFYGDKYK